jgi:3D (Asp-Asp-Asp) domain-containing protein
MSKRQQRRKARDQWFRRMFLVALLMGLAMGFVFGRCSAIVRESAPDATIEQDQLTAVIPDVTLEPVETPLVEESVEPEPVLLGSFRVTAYCSCEKCCGEWAKNRPNGIVYGAAGVELKAGVSCASPLPLGTVVEVEGLGEYIVQDRPAQWVIDKYGENQIDIYFDNHEAASAFGLKQLNVYLKGEPEK